MLQPFLVGHPQGMNISSCVKACTFPEDDLQERVETCRSSIVLIVNALCCKTLCLVVYSSILTVSAQI